jgi:hypothetical protein
MHNYVAGMFSMGKEASKNLGRNSYLFSFIIIHLNFHVIGAILRESQNFIKSLYG